MLNAKSNFPTHGKLGDSFRCIVKFSLGFHLSRTGIDNQDNGKFRSEINQAQIAIIIYVGPDGNQFDTLVNFGFGVHCGTVDEKICSIKTLTTFSA